LDAAFKPNSCDPIQPLVGGTVVSGRLGGMQVRKRRGGDLLELVAIAARVHRADGYPIYLPEADLVRFLTRPEPLAAWVAMKASTSSATWR
jgi:hypothetical protein